MPQLPSGTVTFVFSDIEGSTALLKRLGDDAYAELLRTHRRLVRDIFAGDGGQEIDTQGDAFFYSFPRARAAVAAAVAVQRAHAEHDWPGGVEVRLRLGLHTGEPAVGEEGYTGLDVVRASRIATTGRGGQVLLSDTTRAIVATDLPDGVTLRRLGERRLKDIEEPELVSELVIYGLPPANDALEPKPAATARADTPPPEAPRATTRAPLPRELPEWLRGATERFLPESILPDSNRLIEERVLAEIERAFTERTDDIEQRRRERRRKRGGSREARRPGERAPAKRRSLADEIAKLQGLREAGALSDAQYEQAVERAINGSRED